MPPASEHQKKLRRAVFASAFILVLLVTGVLIMNAFTHASQDLSRNTSTHVANVLLFPMYPFSALDRVHSIPESLYDCLFVATWLATGMFWAALVTLLYAALRKWRTN